MENSNSELSGFIRDSVINEDITYETVVSISRLSGIPYKRLIQLLTGEAIITPVYKRLLSSYFSEEAIELMSRVDNQNYKLSESTRQYSIRPIDAGSVIVGDSIEVIDVGMVEVTGISESNKTITLYSNKVKVFSGSKHSRISIVPKRRR